MIDVDAIVREASSLEPLPPSTTRLAGILSRRDWQMDEVVQIVSLDQGLTGQLLKIANSAALAASARISTVQEAVVRMGSGWVLSVAVGGATGKYLKQELPAYGAGEGQLWRHSVASALAAEALRAECRVPVPTAAFTAALLHDVGKLILSRHLRADAIECLKRARRDRGMTLVRAETEILEVNHGELGGMIARHWKLPEEVVAGVVHHHEPAECKSGVDRPTCWVVQLADAVANQIGAHFGDEPPVGDDVPLALEALELPAESFESLCRRVSADLDATLAAYK